MAEVAADPEVASSATPQPSTQTCRRAKDIRQTEHQKNHDYHKIVSWDSPWGYLGPSTSLECFLQPPTSVQTWSAQLVTCRASKPSALQNSVKQLAHSPHRPRRVSRSLAGLLYLGTSFFQNYIYAYFNSIKRHTHRVTTSAISALIGKQEIKVQRGRKHAPSPPPPPPPSLSCRAPRKAVVCAALIAAVALNDARPAHGALLLGRREAPNRRLEGAAPPADAVGAGRFVAPPEEVLLEPTQEALRAPRVLCGCVRVFMVISEERAEESHALKQAKPSHLK